MFPRSSEIKPLFRGSVPFFFFSSFFSFPPLVGPPRPPGGPGSPLVGPAAPLRAALGRSWGSGPAPLRGARGSGGGGPAARAVCHPSGGGGGPRPARGAPAPGGSEARARSWGPGPRLARRSWGPRALPSVRSCPLRAALVGPAGPPGRGAAADPAAADPPPPARYAILRGRGGPRPARGAPRAFRRGLVGATPSPLVGPAGPRPFRSWGPEPGPSRSWGPRALPLCAALVGPAPSPAAGPARPFALVGPAPLCARGARFFRRRRR